MRRVVSPYGIRGKVQNGRPTGPLRREGKCARVKHVDVRACWPHNRELVSVVVLAEIVSPVFQTFHMQDAPMQARTVTSPAVAATGITKSTSTPAVTESASTLWRWM